MTHHSKDLPHYALPDGNVQIAFSGGRTSSYMLHQILEANGGLPDRAEVVFTNTGREMPQTLDFVQECGERWNVPITWVEYRRAKPLFEVVSHNSASRNGEPFAELIRKKQYLPNQAQRFCTVELKVLAAKRYLVSQGWKSWTNIVGIRADEAHREKQPKDEPRYVKAFPLIRAGITKHDIADFWKRQPFDLRLPLVNGKTIHGNCDGCFLKSEATLAALARDMPDRHQWWEDQEAVVADLTLGSGARFRKEYSRRELRWMVENQEWIFDTEDALCQADGGECMG